MATMTRTRGEVMEVGWRTEVGVGSARGSRRKVVTDIVKINSKTK